jgi:ubiquinone/menaquinone biosynthesis C-methylase UbiE
VSVEQIVERGRPARYGQEITRRRARIVEGFFRLGGKTILDFGCGNGAQTVELAKHASAVIGCDIDASDIEVLRTFARENGISSVVPVLYDGKSLPVKDESVDAVVSFAVLEHVTDEKSALRDILRVLKKGGDFVISVPNKWWIFETHGARLPLLPWNRVPFFSWLPSAIHRRYAMARIYTLAGIVNLLRSNGFEVRKTCYMTAPMDVVPWPAVQKLMRIVIFRGDTTPLPNLSTEIFVHCRKPSA